MSKKIKGFGAGDSKKRAKRKNANVKLFKQPLPVKGKCGCIVDKAIQANFTELVSLDVGKGEYLDVRKTSDFIYDGQGFVPLSKLKEMQEAGCGCCNCFYCRNFVWVNYSKRNVAKSDLYLSIKQLIQLILASNTRWISHEQVGHLLKFEESLKIAEEYFASLPMGMAIKSWDKKPDKEKDQIWDEAVKETQALAQSGYIIVFEIPL